MSNSRNKNRGTPKGNGDRPNKEQDLRATEDSIRADLFRFAAVEATKTALDPTDPELDRLSDEAVKLAEGLARKARAERQLGQDLA